MEGRMNPGLFPVLVRSVAAWMVLSALALTFGLELLTDFREPPTEYCRADLPRK
jgi:hypothetical protein